MKGLVQNPSVHRVEPVIDLFFQIRFATDSTLISLLDYASCILLIEGAKEFVLDYALGRRRNLVMGFFMCKNWIAMMT